MKTILCFGDSNTYGYIPGSLGKRFAHDKRWTGLLSRELGQTFHVIEEGLNSRTITSVDTRPGKEGCVGRDFLMPCLRSHMPVDLVVVMLGTNELKTMFKHFGNRDCRNA